MSNNQKIIIGGVVAIIIIAIIAAVLLIKPANKSPDTNSNNNSNSNSTATASTVKTYTNAIVPDFSLTYDSANWKLNDTIDNKFPLIALTKGDSRLDIAFSKSEGYGGSGVFCDSQDNFVKIDSTWARVFDTANKTYDYAQIAKTTLPDSSKFDDLYDTYAEDIKDNPDYGDALLKSNVVACYEEDYNLNFTSTTVTQDTIDPNNKNKSGFLISLTSSDKNDIAEIDHIVKSIKF